MSFRLPALSAAIYLVLLCVPVAGLCDHVLFRDDFENGTSDNWEIVEFGAGEVVDGAYCLVTACEP